MGSKFQKYQFCVLLYTGVVLPVLCFLHCSMVGVVVLVLVLHDLLCTVNCVLLYYLCCYAIHVAA